MTTFVQTLECRNDDRITCFLCYLSIAFGVYDVCFVVRSLRAMGCAVKYKAEYDGLVSQYKSGNVHQNRTKQSEHLVVFLLRFGTFKGFRGSGTTVSMAVQECIDLRPYKNAEGALVADVCYPHSPWKVSLTDTSLFFDKSGCLNPLSVLV